MLDWRTDPLAPPPEWFARVDDEKAARLELCGRLESTAIARRAREAYRSDPDLWADSLCWGIDPRLAQYGLPTVVPMQLWPAQRRLFHYVLEGRRLAVDAARDTGKTFVFAMAYLWAMLYREGVKWGVGSKTGADVYDGTVDSVGGKFQHMLTHMPPAIVGDWTLRTTPHFHLRLGNGNEVVGRMTTPDAWHGPRKTGILLDECARIPWMARVMTGVDGATNAPGLVTTPNGPVGWWPDLVKGRGASIVEAGPEPAPDRVWEHVSLYADDDPRHRPEWEAAKRATMTEASFLTQYKLSYEVHAEGAHWPEFRAAYHVLDEETWARVLESVAQHVRVIEAWDPGALGTAVVWLAYAEATDEAFVLDWSLWTETRAPDYVAELARLRSELAPSGWRTAANPLGRLPDMRVGDPAMYARAAATQRSWRDDMAALGVELTAVPGLANRADILRKRVGLAFRNDKLWLSPRCLRRCAGLTLPEVCTTYRQKMPRGEFTGAHLLTVKDAASHPAEALCYGVDAAWPEGLPSAIVVPEGASGALRVLE